MGRTKGFRFGRGPTRLLVGDYLIDQTARGQQVCGAGAYRDGLTAALRQGDGCAAPGVVREEGDDSRVRVEEQDRGRPWLGRLSPRAVCHATRFSSTSAGEVASCSSTMMSP